MKNINDIKYSSCHIGTMANSEKGSQAIQLGTFGELSDGSVIKAENIDEMPQVIIKHSNYLYTDSEYREELPPTVLDKETLKHLVIFLGASPIWKMNEILLAIALDFKSNEKYIHDYSLDDLYIEGVYMEYDEEHNTVVIEPSVGSK